MKHISRREFLKYVGAGTVSLIAQPKIGLSLTDKLVPASTVVQCFDENATSGSSINESVVQIMVDESIKTITGIGDAGEAWKSLFPGITESSVIGIKVNCINESLPGHPVMTNCIVNGLTQMTVGAGNFIRNNVIIWDRTDHELNSCGYTIYDGSDANTVRCFGTNHSGEYYDSSTPLAVAGYTSYPSSILSQRCDYLIDCAVFKNHNTAQVTLCMKNHYGSINNPGSLHSGACSPGIPSLNQQIRDAITPNNIQKIFIIDALFGSIRYGPGGSADCNPQKLLMSFDPVACDYRGWELINEERVAHGWGQISWPIYHIQAAAQDPYNLGTTDVNLVEINNPSSVEESRNERLVNGMLAVTPNPIRRTAVITVALKQASAVYLDVVDSSGRICQHIFNGDLRSGTHRINFNRTARLSSGTYFVRMHNNGTSSVKKVTILN
jgi:uncharacterized protein (DUF362 family)